MVLKFSKRFLPLLALFLCGAGGASAGTLYVSTTGDDGTGDGSSGSPFATVQHAVDVAAAGDTVVVAAGNYTENITLTKQIVLQGANIGVPGTGTRGTESAINGYVKINAAADASRVDGFSIAGGTILGQKTGIYVVADADNVTVINNLFRRTAAHNAFRGVITEIANSVTSIDNLTVQDNLFDDGASPSAGNGWGTGVYFNPYTNGSISSNTFSGNNVGISVDGPNGGTVAISDNTFAASEYEGVGIGPNGAVTVTGNDFQGSNATYIGSYSSATDLDATTNTFDGVLGSDLTTPQGFAVEDKIGHRVDAPASGFAGVIRVRDNYVYVTPNSGSIQRGIDIADNGDTVEVQAGAYGRESAANRYLFSGAGPYKFGLFIEQDDLVLRGYGAGDVPVTDADDVAISFTTNATNSFGYAGTFVQGDNVTISGLGFGNNFDDSNVMSPANSWKVLEIIGDNLTFAHNVVNATAAVFFNDMRFDTAGDLSHIASYTVTDNHFNMAAKLSLNSGTGYGHAASLRQITGNAFDMNNSTVETDVALWFAGTDPVGYLHHPVGGAVVENNTFSNGARRYVLASGTYDAAQVDLMTIWNLNTFDRKTASVDPSGPAFRSYTSAPFTNLTQIGASVAYELANIAQDGDVVLVGAGTYPDEVMNLAHDVTVQGESAANRPVLTGLVRNVGNTTLNDVLFKDLILRNDNAILEFVAGTAIDGVTFDNVDFDFNGTATPITPATYRSVVSMPGATVTGAGLSFLNTTMGIGSPSTPMTTNFYGYFWFQGTGGPILFDSLDLSGTVYDGADLVGAQINFGTGAVNVTIRNSYIHDGGNFYLSGMDSLEIYNNTFERSGLALNGVSNTDVHHNSFSDIYAPGDSLGLIAGGTQNRSVVLKKAWGEANGNVNVSIRNNTFDNVQIPAVLVDQYTDADPDASTFDNVTVQDNSFENTPTAIENTYASVIVPAECNWYGSGAIGDVTTKIAGEVDFVPYRTGGGNTAAIGFDPDSAASCAGLAPVVVKRDSTIIESYFAIQDALNAVGTIAGDSVLVYNSGGDYNESPLISKDVILVYAGGSICTTCVFILDVPGLDSTNFVDWGTSVFNTVAVTTNGAPADAVALANTGGTVRLATAGVAYTGPIVLTKEITLAGGAQTASDCGAESDYIIDGGTGAAVEATGAGDKVVRDILLAIDAGGNFASIGSGSSGNVTFERVQFERNSVRIYGLQELTTPSILADGNDIPEYLTNSGSGSFVYGERAPFSTTGLVAGWKGEDANANSVQTLYDYSSSAVNLTQTAVSRRPTKLANGINSRAALSIPASGTRVLDASTTTTISGGAAKTLFVVFQLPASGSSADKVIYKQGDDVNGISVVFDDAENVELNVYDGASTATFETAIAGGDMGKTYIAQIYFDGASAEKRVGFALDNSDDDHWEDTVNSGDFSATTLTAPAINAASSISLGGRYGSVYADGAAITAIGYGNSFNGGRIGEVMVLNTADKDVRDQVYCYLNAKYNGGADENALERTVVDIATDRGVAGEELARAVVSLYPNPVTDRAMVEVTAPSAQQVTVTLLNSLGEQVAFLYDGRMDGGESILTMLDATDLPAGTYMVLVAGESFRELRRITVLR